TATYGRLKIARLFFTIIQKMSPFRLYMTISCSLTAPAVFYFPWPGLSPPPQPTLTAFATLQ
ncbi:MAG: hypothetical protein OSJ44_16065, partial [Lachnospiraceae bacterium]|nr:hypothetical protein [Lachnospiraceae bacterium]